MRYNSIIFNDTANAPGICVSVYLQGCPHHCPGCFNVETWDFNGGIEFTSETMNTIIKAINNNNILRSLCLLGGEPLCPENRSLTLKIIKNVIDRYPFIKIYIWTGYYLSDLIDENDSVLNEIFRLSYCIIDGPFIEKEKDLTLQMRGSRNQIIHYLH